MRLGVERAALAQYRREEISIPRRPGNPRDELNRGEFQTVSGNEEIPPRAGSHCTGDLKRRRVLELPLFDINLLENKNYTKSRWALVI
jgi:hypothetical protein